MDLAKHWRQRATRYRLEGQRHRETGAVRFPPAPTEQEEIWEAHTLSGRGSVYSFSVVRQAPAGFGDVVPYVVALVALEEGPVITAQLTDCDISDVQIGMPVESVTRKLRDLGDEGLIVYGYKFRPVLG